MYLSFKTKIALYGDEDFQFRRRMIKNVPYFRGLSDDIIENIVYLLKPHRYDQDTTIIKYGDITDKIHFVKEGEIDVSIPVRTYDRQDTHFETLNAGSCFCAFSAFSRDIQQLVNFRARTDCVIETIDVADLEGVAQHYLQLSDEIRRLALCIKNQDKSELDFFRYLKPRKKALPEKVRRIIKRKFQAAVWKFIRMIKQSNNFNAIVSLQQLM